MILSGVMGNYIAARTDKKGFFCNSSPPPSCGVRARKALFYKVFAGSYFLSGSVKNRHFERKWCSKWCSKMTVEDEKIKLN